MPTNLTRDLLSILRAGASITISAVLDKRDCLLLAQAAKQAGTLVTFKNAAAYSVEDCQEIASAGARHVMFDLT